MPLTIRTKWVLALIVIFVLLLAAATFVSPSATVNSTNNSKTISISTPSSEITDYLTNVIQFAHEGYLADSISGTLDPSDASSEMASIIELTSHEKTAISELQKYASSTNSNIKLSALLLLKDESDVLLKHEQGLDVMRQISNGDNPTDVQYTIAELKASQDNRNSDFISVLPLFSAMTMDLSASSSSPTIGPLSPNSALTSEEKDTILTALRYEFGDKLNSQENDIFLLLAQNLNLLLTSDTYSQYYGAWITYVKSIK